MTISLPHLLARILTALVLAILLIAPNVARADERDHCRNMIHRDQEKLEWAVSNHGRGSMEADISRQNLNEARQRCWDEFHVWWNDRDASWHDVNDWDDYDRHH